MRVSIVAAVLIVVTAASLGMSACAWLGARRIQSRWDYDTVAVSELAAREGSLREQFQRVSASLSRLEADLSNAEDRQRRSLTEQMGAPGLSRIEQLEQRLRSMEDRMSGVFSTDEEIKRAEGNRQVVSDAIRGYRALVMDPRQAAEKRARAFAMLLQCGPNEEVLTAEIKLEIVQVLLDQRTPDEVRLQLLNLLRGRAWNEIGDVTVTILDTPASPLVKLSALLVLDTNESLRSSASAAAAIAEAARSDSDAAVRESARAIMNGERIRSKKGNDKEENGRGSK